MRTLSFALCALLSAALPAGCAGPLVALQRESHPPGGAYLVAATIEEWPGCFYSTAITIRNRTERPLKVVPTMFRLEGTSPTGFVPAGDTLLFFGEWGYQMPATIAPRSSVQGEVFFEIRGTNVPAGPVRLVVDLPDGEHAFDFELIH
jgi:hypothetical protein